MMKTYRGINQLNYKTLNNVNYFIQRVVWLICYLKKKKKRVDVMSSILVSLIFYASCFG